MSANIFTVKRSEIEGRLDPFFYRPDFMELEKLMKKIGAQPLRKFVKGIASGATPKADEYEKYYSDKENGIPFLRVQNLSPTSILNYEDCKYINKETHENMLCRSQANEGDLLVKITGVGRMAVASVAPKGFVGNTNQHMCVIKTADEKTSWILASWLNTDIAEKLASRRATGGTRPALDYPALLSIPIIFDERIYETMKKAVSEMKKKQEQAKELLASIDSYLLSELGITLPQKDNSLSKRIFTTKFSEVTGGRWDCSYTFKISALARELQKIKCETLENLIICNPQYGANEEAVDYSEGSTRYIRITDIDELGNLKEVDLKSAETIEEKYLLNENDILFARSGSVGRCYIHKDMTRKSIFAGYLIRFVLNKELINPDYLFYYCNSSIYKYWVDSIQRPAVQANINSQEYKSLTIPLPPLPKQKEIAEHIRSIRTQAKQLQSEAEQILQDAKHQVKKMILGEQI